jgi:hypothetical protein
VSNVKGTRALGLSINGSMEVFKDHICTLCCVHLLFTPMFKIRLFALKTFSANILHEIVNNSQHETRCAKALLCCPNLDIDLQKMAILISTEPSFCLMLVIMQFLMCTNICTLLIEGIVSKCPLDLISRKQVSL